MPTLLLLLSGALAAEPASAPWPSDVPLVFEFRYRLGDVVTDEWGWGLAGTRGDYGVTWRCTAKPARKNGRQELTCDVPNLGSVWMLWGPGRELLQLDIDEDASTLGADRWVHRVGVLAGALELSPPTKPVVGAKWKQGGDFRVLVTAPGYIGTSYELEHTVASVEGGEVLVTSAGRGVGLLGRVESDTESRVEVSVVGEARFQGASGMLLERFVRVQPTQMVPGTRGTVGHLVAVRLVVSEPAALAPRAAP